MQTTRNSRRQAPFSGSSSRAGHPTGGLAQGPRCYPHPASDARPTINRIRTVAVAADAVTIEAEDKWIARALAPLNSPAVPSSLKAVNSSSLEALRTLRMPTTRNEEYRYTDISLLLKSSLEVASSATISSDFTSAHILPEAATSFVVVVNGILRPELSNITGLPKGVYVGSIQGAPAGAAEKLGSLASARGGPFSVINGLAARDALTVVVPAGVVVETPLHVIYMSTGGASARTSSAPRLLLLAAPHSAMELVEEYVGASASGQYFTCGVTEILLEDHAQVRHGYAEREHAEAIHVKSTLVQQAANSQYCLTEARVGGALTRHDLGVEQVGVETQTTLRHFIISGSAQLHDLHSKLELNHPRGEAKQLHKCIVAHSSGKGIFDGNVKVNKFAQQTDAQQLSRNLLLVPLATVNIKPNLQIIADDVKCTHGCAVSDLQDDELFYFRARGIDADTARRALVSSFGAEVTQHLKYKGLLSRVQKDVSKKLAEADISAATSAAQNGAGAEAA